MKYYFVDFENVHTDGLAGIDKLDNGTVVYILYAENCKNISLEILEKAEASGIRISAYKAHTGSKNALDFQLASLLGYVIGKTDPVGGTEYVIVSKDTGYDVVIDFWKQKGITIGRCNGLGGNIAVERVEKAASVPKKKTAKGIVETTKDEVLKYIPPEDYSEELLDIINSYKTKQAINNGFSKMLKDSKKSGAIYKKLKQLFKEKNKT